MTPTTSADLDLLRARMAAAIGGRMAGHLPGDHPRTAQEILLKAAAGVQCRLGVELAGLTQDGPRALVSFADG